MGSERKSQEQLREEIRGHLSGMREEEYQKFQSKLIPTVEEERILGIRTPLLRSYAKELYKREEIGEFLADLPHGYFEENQLHAFLVSEEKNLDLCLTLVRSFLPFVDNWATCDQMNPKVFKKHKEKLLPHIWEWMKSEETYTIRFGIRMLMAHFLDEGFSIEQAERVAKVSSSDYYVQMMMAWYFATALAKQYESILPLLEGGRLGDWVHQKTIQKAIESYRITPEQKDYLRSLKKKKRLRACSD